MSGFYEVTATRCGGGGRQIPTKTRVVSQITSHPAAAAPSLEDRTDLPSASSARPTGSPRRRSAYRTPSSPAGQPSLHSSIKFGGRPLVARPDFHASSPERCEEV